MKKVLFLIILFLLLLIVLISLTGNDTSHLAGNYSGIETQMRKLWY